jgi:hypothetical protein
LYLGAAFGGLLFSLARTKPVVLAHAGSDQERKKMSGADDAL